MSELVASAGENWIPLAAALWLASIFFLVYSARRYFASRRPQAGRALNPLEPFIVDRPLETTPAAEREASTHVDDPSRWVAAANDLGAAPAATLIPSANDPAGTSVFDAVRMRFAGDCHASKGLSDLIRALYLDQSTFTFHTISELNADDRELAKHLIAQWLADPSAVERWEAIHEMVRKADAVGYPAESRGVVEHAMYGSVDRQLHGS